MEKKKKPTASVAHNRATAKYNAANTKQFPFRLNLNTDQDILKKLETVPSVAGYIKELIRADLEKSRK